jgi:hypothetical protein
MAERGEIAATRTGQTAAQNDITPSASEVAVTTDLMLAAYVKQITPSRFTEDAEAVLLSEIKQYAQDICVVTEAKRRRDRRAERALKQHVEDAAAFLRSNRRNDVVDIAGDWSKWIGFAFVGFAVQQWIHVSTEKPIAPGSVTWLVLDAVVAAGLIVGGFIIDKPWGYFSDFFRRGGE